MKASNFLILESKHVVVIPTFKTGDKLRHFRYSRANISTNKFMLALAMEARGRMDQKKQAF